MTQNTWKFVGPLVAIAAITIAAFCYDLKLGPFRQELSRERFLEVRGSIRNTTNAVIIFGDSIVHGASLPSTICGVRVVNAGISGAGIRYFHQHSQELLGRSSPKLVVLAVGINDSGATGFDTFRLQYMETAAGLSGQAALLLATITPIRPGPITTVNPARIPSLNEMIREIAGRRSVIDLNNPLMGGDFTVDGVHLTAKGYELWTDALVAGISRELGCDAKSAR